MPYFLQKRSAPFVEYRLKNNASTAIGREPTEGIFLDKDSSVSRKHATLKVTNDSTVSISDSSRYGTFVNGEKVVGERLVQIGDKVDFGMNKTSDFVIKYVPVVLCFSGLTKAEKEKMQELAANIGATIKEEFDPTVTHVVLPAKSWRVTPKVLDGMMNQKEIVAMDWLKQFDSAKTGGVPDPNKSRPGPMSQAQTSQLVTMSMSQMAFAQQQSSITAVFAPRSERSKLFSSVEFFVLPSGMEPELGIETDLLKKGGARKIIHSSDAATMTLVQKSPTRAIVICSGSIETFRATHPDLKKFPAANKQMIIQAVLTSSELTPIAPVDLDPPLSPLPPFAPPPEPRRTPIREKVMYAVPTTMEGSKAQEQIKAAKPGVVEMADSSGKKPTTKALHSTVEEVEPLAEATSKKQNISSLFPEMTPPNAKSADDNLDLQRPRYPMQFVETSLLKDGEMPLPQPSSSVGKDKSSTKATTKVSMSKALADIATTSSAKTSMMNATKKRKSKEPDLFDLGKEDEATAEKEELERRRERHRALVDEEHRRQLHQQPYVPPTDSGWLRKPTKTVEDDVDNNADDDEKEAQEPRPVIEVEDLIVRKLPEASISPSGMRSAVPGDKKRFRKNQVAVSADRQALSRRKEVDVVVQSGLSEQLAESNLRAEERKMLAAFGVALENSAPGSKRQRTIDELLPSSNGAKKKKSRTISKSSTSKRKRMAEESDSDSDDFDLPSSSDDDGHEGDQPAEEEELELSTFKPSKQPQPVSPVKSELEEIFTDDDVSEVEIAPKKAVAAKPAEKTAPLTLATKSAATSKGASKPAVAKPKKKLII